MLAGTFLRAKEERTFESEASTRDSALPFLCPELNLPINQSAMNDKSLNLGKGPILPLLLKMSGPSIAAMLAMAVYNFIDAFWLARLSPEAIAALTICFPLQFIFGGIGVGTGIGAGSYASRMLGAGEILKARQTAGQVFFLSASLGFLLVGGILAAPDPILKFFGASTEILPLSRLYLITTMPGVPFLFLIMMINNLLRAEGRPNASMFAVFFIAAISAILDPLLIFGWGPFPRLEIQGAALAAVISQISGAALSFYYLQQKSSKYRLRWKDLVPNPLIILSIYSTGFPSIVINLVVSFAMFLHNFILAGYSNLAVATLGIIFRTNGLIMMMLYGFGHGLMPLVGFSEGAKLYSRLMESVKIAVRISFAIALLSCLLVEVFASPIAAFFSPDLQLHALTETALRINFLMLLTGAPSLMWINMFIGLGRGTTAMFLLVARETLFLIPLLFFLSSRFGINGVWMAQPLANALAFLFILYWTKRQYRFFESQAAS
ncbi:MAG: Multidrug export protein MepA [Syntrophus sp. PtaU1.Bin208]|nr:MAG: Multidrug export protein MepA [Syntrophus sp. PtaU1.Bin208]